VKPLTRGLLHPDPRSVCPLSSAEFVEPPPEQKILGRLLPVGPVSHLRVSQLRRVYNSHFQVTHVSGDISCVYYHLL
jgi:hypothetical protein